MARVKSAAFDDIRGSILDAAARLFAAQGFRNTNIIDIGRACQASKSRMYHYFASKEAMLDEMLEQHVSTLVALAEPLANGPGEPAVRLREYLLLHLRHYHQGRDRHRVLVEDADHLGAEARSRVKALEHRLVGLLGGLLHEIAPAHAADEAAGKTADKAAATAHAMLIYGMLNWTYTWYRPSGRLGLEALADQATRLCLHGIAGEAAAEPRHRPAPASTPTRRPR